jgi:hypothetical protein
MSEHAGRPGWPSRSGAQADANRAMRAGERSDQETQ